MTAIKHGPLEIETSSDENGLVHIVLTKPGLPGELRFALMLDDAERFSAGILKAVADGRERLAAVIGRQRALNAARQEGRKAFLAGEPCPSSQSEGDIGLAASRLGGWKAEEAGVTEEELKEDGRWPGMG